MWYHGHWGEFRFSGRFFLSLHILSPGHICWPLFPLSHRAFMSYPPLHQLRGMVLFAVPPLCDPTTSLPHSLQGILLVNRHQLTMTRHVIMIYLLVAPSCTYLRPILVLVLEGGSHHFQMPPKYPLSVLLVSLLIDFLDRIFSWNGVTELI